MEQCHDLVHVFFCWHVKFMICFFILLLQTYVVCVKATCTFLGSSVMGQVKTHASCDCCSIIFIHSRDKNSRWLEVSPTIIFFLHVQQRFSSQYLHLERNTKKCLPMATGRVVRCGPCLAPFFVSLYLPWKEPSLLISTSEII